MNGKTVYSSNQKTVAGINNIRIDISKLSAGSYLIGLLASDGEMQTIKFIKE